LCSEAISRWISSWLSLSTWWLAFFFSVWHFKSPVAQSLAEGKKLGCALLELAKGFDLGAVVGDLGWVAQAARYGASPLVLERIESVGPATDFGAVFADALDKLFGDGATADLIEIFDLGKELTATCVELGGGGWLHM
jgi:hypothetical protein